MKDYDDVNAHLYLLYSTNYNGTGNPHNYTWQNISDEAYWSPGDYEWVESGIIDLSGIVGGQVYIAFQYDSEAGSSKTWQIDDVSISASPTSINSNVQEQEFTLYPNPAHDYISISTSSNKALDMSIYHSTGKLIKRELQIRQKSKINISDLSAGFYLIKIDDGMVSKTTSLVITK